MEATATATASILFPHLHPSLPSPTLSSLSKFPLSVKSSPSRIHLRISNSTLIFPFKFPLHPSSTRPTYELHASVESVEEVALEENPKETEDNPKETEDNPTETEENPKDTEDKILKRKLYVVNLPFSLSSDDLKKVFSECGTVKDVEIIRDKDGKNRGYAFVAMSSGEEAQAVIDKFHTKELSGRTIRVEFARRLKKPRPQPPIVIPYTETRHKLYVSNLQWKVRANHLRDFFSSTFTPVSVRVVFERSPSGRSAGYGFVSFNTKEEAEEAISSLDGKELLGRPIRLKFSEQNSESETTKEGEEKADELNESTTSVLDEKDSVDESTTSVLDEKEASKNQPDES